MTIPFNAKILLVSLLALVALPSVSSLANGSANGPNESQSVGYAQNSQSSGTSILPQYQLGINDKETDVAGDHGIFCNNWVGIVDGKPYSVVAGYEYSDPLQGMLVIVTEYGKPHIPTPTATGPICIISEKEDILTLRSTAGRYERVDQDEKESYVTSPGNMIYHFNVRTGKFQ